MKTKEKKLPKYVRLGGTEMILQGDKYYRHAGRWSCGYKWVNGKLYSVIPTHSWVHNKELIEISELEWRDGNEGYV